MKLLTVLMICSRMLAATFSDSDNKATIATAAEKYVVANSAISNLRVTIEKVDGSYARAKATPRDGATDPAWVFLKKQNGAWIGLTLGTSFTPEDYREFGIPRGLWIK